ncbi:MAG: hypothetical protein ACTHWH_17570 [Marinobacter sp.]
MRPDSNGGSLLDPLLDLSSGGVSAVPTLGQLRDGTPQLLTEAGVAIVASPLGGGGFLRTGPGFSCLTAANQR